MAITKANEDGKGIGGANPPSSKKEFNAAAKGEEKKSFKAPAGGGSDQVKNTKFGLHEGPKPPEPTRGPVTREAHFRAMEADHKKATGHGFNAEAAKAEKAKGPPKKGDLSKSFKKHT